MGFTGQRMDRVHAKPLFSGHTAYWRFWGRQPPLPAKMPRFDISLLTPFGVEQERRPPPPPVQGALFPTKEEATGGQSSNSFLKVVALCISSTCRLGGDC